MLYTVATITKVIGPFRAVKLAFSAGGDSPLSNLIEGVQDMKSIDKIDVREVRRKLGMNQSQFWSKIGVTQSGGSRYESGRNIPKPVQALLRLVHVEQIDVNRIRRDDMEVIEYLRAKDPAQLKELKKAAKAHGKK